MWTIRIILLGVLVALDVIGAYLLKYRRQYKRLFESTFFNIVLVVVGHCVCYLIVILPPDGGWSARPVWMQHTIVRIGFPVIGLLLICAGAFLGIATFKQRKVIGIQNVEEGLLTSGLCNQNAEALSMAHPGTNPLLIRNECRNSTKWSGICFQNNSGGIAEDNISENNLVGIAIIDSSNAILRGNICKNNTGNGLFLGKDSGCSAELNLFENNKKWGISIEENSRQFDISNNTCRGNVAGGIRIASFPTGSIIKGNLVEKNGIGLGIYVNTPSPLEELNTLRGNTKAVEK